MDFGVNGNVLDQKGSPAIYSSTLATRPSAGFVGRIFISTDTFEIYRDNGTTWDLIGSGSSGTLQTVTDAGNSTTNNMNVSYTGGTITSGEAAFGATATYTPITDQGSLDFYGLVGQYVLNLSNAGFSGADTFNRTGLYGATAISGNDGSISTALFASVTGAVTFNNVLLDRYAVILSKRPDFLGVNSINSLYGCYIQSMADAGVLFPYGVYQEGSNDINYFASNKTNFIYGLKLDGINAEYYFGDHAVNNNGTFLFIDDVNQRLRTYFQNNQYGLEIEDAAKTITIGDYGLISNGTFLRVDDNNQQLEISANLLSNSAGGSSGQHLVIVSGGNTYKIALLNP